MESAKSRIYLKYSKKPKIRKKSPKLNFIPLSDAQMFQAKKNWHWLQGPTDRDRSNLGDNYQVMKNSRETVSREPLALYDRGNGPFIVSLVEWAILGWNWFQGSADRGHSDLGQRNKVLKMRGEPQTLYERENGQLIFTLLKWTILRLVWFQGSTDRSVLRAQFGIFS